MLISPSAPLPFAVARCCHSAAREGDGRSRGELLRKAREAEALARTPGLSASNEAELRHRAHRLALPLASAARARAAEEAAARSGCMALDTTDDRDLFDFASFDDLPGRPVAREPEQDKQQRALAREVEAAPYRAEHYGLN